MFNCITAINRAVQHRRSVVCSRRLWGWHPVCASKLKSPTSCIHTTKKTDVDGATKSIRRKHIRSFGYLSLYCRLTGLHVFLRFFNIPVAAGESSCFPHRQCVFRAVAHSLSRPPSGFQAGNATAYMSTDIAMDVVPGGAPFEFVIEGLDQESSEPAGYGVRVSAANGAGYGRPSATLNIKVMSDEVLGFGWSIHLSGTPDMQI